jgi:hypothetical protein
VKRCACERARAKLEGRRLKRGVREHSWKGGDQKSVRVRKWERGKAKEERAKERRERVRESKSCTVGREASSRGARGRNVRG